MTSRIPIATVLILTLVGHARSQSWDKAPVPSQPSERTPVLNQSPEPAAVSEPSSPGSSQVTSPFEFFFHEKSPFFPDGCPDAGGLSDRLWVSTDYLFAW